MSGRKAAMTQALTTVPWLCFWNRRKLGDQQICFMQSLGGNGGQIAHQPEDTVKLHHHTSRNTAWENPVRWWGREDPIRNTEKPCLTLSTLQVPEKNQTWLVAVSKPPKGVFRVWVPKEWTTALEMYSALWPTTGNVTVCAKISLLKVKIHSKVIHKNVYSDPYKRKHYKKSK